MRTEKTLLMGGQVLNSDMNAELVSMQKMIMKAAKEQLRIKSEREEAIFRQAVVEALVAGDFRAYVRPGGELIDVVYAPYAGIQQAREENAYLKRQLAEAREIVEELYLLATSQKTIEEQADAITNARNFLEGKKGEHDA